MHIVKFVGIDLEPNWLGTTKSEENFYCIVKNIVA